MDSQEGKKAERSSADELRLRRSARLAASAFIVSIFVFGIGSVLQFADARGFAEIMHGFKEMLPALSEASQAGSTATNVCHAIALFLFSCIAIWLSQKFAGATRTVLLIQLCVLSLVYQLVCVHFFQAAGHPLSIAIAILLSCFAGIFLKKRDAERRELDAKQIELKLRNDELQESRLALVKQDESERRLLAADLHDQVLNDLRTVQKSFEQYTNAPSNEARDKINTMLKQTMSEIREIMDELCPVLLEEFGIAAAIEDRLDKVSQQQGFEVRLNQSASDERLEKLSSVERQLLYRLVQESLNNVCKHAAASKVKVAIDEEDSQLFFRITDDGKGIDPSRLSESSRGTLYMRLRAALIGAKVSWKQGPDGKGTTVEIRVHVQNTGG